MFEEHVQNLKKAYTEAVTKHPKFCTQFSNISKDYWALVESQHKSVNDDTSKRGIAYADHIILEELAEAFHALSCGDLEQAKAEAYQAASCFLRLIEVIEKKGAKKNA